MTPLGKVLLAVCVFALMVGVTSLMIENAKLQVYQPTEVYTIEYTYPVSLQDADIPEVFREYDLIVEFTMYDDNSVHAEITDMVCDGYYDWVE